VFFERRHKEPFINLRLLCQPAFASASGMGFVLGLTLYGTVYLLPVYLTQIRGYDALQIGEVIMWLGLPQLFIFPIVPAVMRRVDPRLMVAFGFLMFAVSCFMNSYLTHDWAIQEFSHIVAAKAPGAAAAQKQAIAELANMVRIDAFTMAYSDCFFVLGIALLVAMLGLLLVPKPRPGAVGH